MEVVNDLDWLYSPRTVGSVPEDAIGVRLNNFLPSVRNRWWTPFWRSPSLFCEFFRFVYHFVVISSQLLLSGPVWSAWQPAYLDDGVLVDESWIVLKMTGSVIRTKAVRQ